MSLIPLTSATVTALLSKCRHLNLAVSDILKCHICNATNKFCSKASSLPTLDNDPSVVKGQFDINPEDADIAPSLKTVIGDNPDKKCSSDLVPGKGRPPEPPVDCCMSGCANCVWIQYAEELKEYYSDGTERALKEINTIENEALKAFIKLELGLL